MTTTLTSLGFTFKHDKGKIEIDYQRIYGGATVFVQRGNQHGKADLEDAIKNKFVITTNEAERKISLLPEELKFLWAYRPVFADLNKVNADELAKIILQETEFDAEHEEPLNHTGE